MKPVELKDLRTRLGLTQEELGAEVGARSNTVSRWERGATPIPVSKEKLIRVLGQRSAPRLLGGWRFKPHAPGHQFFKDAFQIFHLQGHAHETADQFRYEAPSSPSITPTRSPAICAATSPRRG